MMEAHYFRDFGLKSLWKRANQPNFSSLVWEEYYWIVSAQDSGTWNAFQKFENRDKNRSNFVPCWDHTRVKLTTNNSTASDYIHANYVDGYKDTKKFICTQAPKMNTLNDFCRMVWNENSHIIVVLLNVTPSNEYSYCRYWPLEDDNPFEVGQFTISRIEENVFLNCIVTTLRLTDLSGVSRTIYHFLYTDWTADGFPNDVTEFYKFVLRVNLVRTSALRTMLKLKQDRLGPIIVHCETGIGRTGIFCTVDIAIYRMMKTAMVSLPKIVMGVREQRHSSVTTFEQYFFCYRVLLYLSSQIFKKLIGTNMK